MPECPDCYLFTNTQAEIDTHLLAPVNSGGHGRVNLGTPSVASTIVDKVANSWSVETSGLVITTNYRGIIINDQHTVIAEPTLKKWILIQIVSNVPTELIPEPTQEVYIFERFDDKYEELTSEKKVVETLKQFSVEGGGTTLTEESIEGL